MNIITIVSTLALTLTTSTAFAETASRPASSPPAPSTLTTELVLALAPGGVLLGDAPSVPVKYVAVQPGDLVTSGLIGAKIYNTLDEDIGKVVDLVVSGGNEVTGVIASVGGFLGMGESYVVLDPSTVVVNEKDGSWRAYVNTTKDDLTSAPKFVYPIKSG